MSHGNMTFKLWEGLGKEINPKDHLIVPRISMLTKTKKKEM